MNVLKLIPYGHENGITRGELVSLTGLPDRQVRKQIEELRRDIPIVNMQDGKGYFRPNEDEMHLVNEWVLVTRAKATSTLKSTDGALRWMFDNKRWGGEPDA